MPPVQVQKLSQIALAGSPPALTDTVVGVGLGTTDFQYTLSQIQTTVGGIAAATSSLDFYVATTGSDSNPGTIGSPFATLQHALLVALKFDYQSLYTFTIHIADGTYPFVGGVLIASAPIRTASNPTIVGNAATPTNVVFQFDGSAISGVAAFDIEVADSRFNIGGFQSSFTVTTNNNEYHFRCQGPNSLWQITNPIVLLTINGPSTTAFRAGLSATYGIAASVTIISTSNQMLDFYFADSNSAFIAFFSTIILPVGLGFNDAFINIQGVSGGYNYATIFGATITNGGTVVGNQLIAGTFSFMAVTNSLADIPGSGVTILDDTGLLAGNPQFAGQLIPAKAHVIRPANFMPNTWSMFQDTSANTFGLYVHNGTVAVNLTPVLARVTSQFNKTNDAVLANIPGLSFNAEAGCSYQFDATLFTTSNAGGGVQAAIAGTCTATAIIYEGETTNAGAIAAQTRAAALATSVGAVTAVTAARIDIEGLITVNAEGTLTVQFAQNVGNGTASSVLVGSYMIVNQVQ